MNRLLFLFTLCLALVSAQSFAQEICNNGIDDDGDNFVDCFDNSCAANSLCDGFYIGNDADCTSPPSSFPEFAMEEEWESPNETVNHLNRVSIGDLDKDGVPEVVSINISTRKIFILNGATGQIKRGPITVDYKIERESIIGNINNDGCAEIFVYGEDVNDDDKWRIYAYDCNLNEIWRSADNSVMKNNPYYLSLANFDGDNFVELYYKDEIVDAHTGVRLVKTGNNGDGTDHFNYLAAPVAVDILGDAKLELVAGGRIYSVSLPARTLHSGSLTLSKSINNYRVRKSETSTTSVADYDLDGNLDVIITGSNYTGSDTDITDNVNQNTTVFYWNVAKNTVKTYIDAFPDIVNVYDCKDGNPGAVSQGDFYKNGWRNGTGRINLADIDGDGKLNAVYVSGKYLYALDENWQQKWRLVVKEETSGYTGCTMFDFNGDGNSEIVYRDEEYIYIISGDGTIGVPQKCISRTNREYPIVADVDGDGSTEICVTCAYDDNLSADDFCDKNSTGRQRYSVVRAYRSATEPWVPARRVWNQHGYFNVNVNDDLTIPKIQQKHHLSFANSSCRPGDPVQPRRPLNTFLNQAPFVDSKGCPVYAAPDIKFVDNSLSVTPPTCPDKNFQVSFQIINEGDASISGKLPIAFYKGDPRTGGIKLDTILLSLNSFAPNQVKSINNLTITADGSAFDLYIVLNDAGTSSPFKLPNTNFLECDYLDNIVNAPVNPLPVPITALKVKDNIKCGTGSTPDNGAARAFILDNGVENTTDFTFYWTAGTVAKPIPADFTGAVQNNRADGDYTVYARHKTALCSSDTALVNIPKVTKTVTAKIFPQNPYDNCKNPNASLKVVVNDTAGDGSAGDHPGNYTYYWFIGPQVFVGDTIGVSHTKTDLNPGSYSVYVVHKASGCPGFDTYTIPDQSVIPQVTTTQVDITCSNATSGSATASVVGGNSNNFTFRWSKGKIAKDNADFTGETYSGLGAGSYTVVAENKSTKCESAPVTVTIGQTPPITVAAAAVTHQTSCDATKPNGSASASVNGGTAGYSFQWFKGQNTLPANRVDTSAVATKLTNGIYTVKATNKQTGCFDTEEVTINFMVVVPNASIAAVANTSRCFPADGKVTVNVSLDAPADYKFFWYDGATVKASPDYSDTTNVLDGLTPGQYTVKAIHRTKHCETAPVTATVGNAIPVVTFVPAAIIEPSDCGKPEGEIEISLSAPGNTSGFDIKWYSGKAPFSKAPILEQNSVTTTRVTGLLAGVYTLVVVNRDNGCEASESYKLNYLNAHKLLFVSQDKVETCDPNDDGGLTVTLVKTPIPGFDETDYDIYVYAGSEDPGASATPLQVIAGVSGQLNYATTVPLTPGMYTLVAVSKHPSTLGCRSAPVIEEVVQDTADPQFTANPVINNENCPGTSGTGQISLNITNPGDYNYEWYEGTDVNADPLGTNTSGTVGGGGTIAQTLVAGKYTVKVTKQAGNSAGCFTTATYQLFDDPPLVTMNLSNDVTLVHVDRCDLPTMGSATVNFVRENDGQNETQIPAADYDFEWFTDSPTGPQLINGQILPSISSLTAGKYYVRPTNKTSMCTTVDLIAFEIEDRTINTVAVDLVDFTVPTKCLKPANITGELEVLASGNSTTGYTYTWHAGTTTAGPVVATVSGADGETAHTLAAGFYTIEVINNTTQCPITDTYELPLDVRPLSITASAEPLTVCYDTPNRDGHVFAYVTSGSRTEYDYNWYIGGTIKASADSVDQELTNLTFDDYLVVAVDQSDAACTISTTVTVTDERIYPIASAMPLAPLTICDPARPDAVASANVEGNMVDYSFDWFEGTPPSGSAFYTGAQASGLKAITYSVIATNIFTGCSDTTQTAIPVMQLPIPMPKIDVLSMKTSCVTDNGSLTASVEGNTSNFIFDWYIGEVEKASPDYTGEIYDSLAVGMYSVTATSRITGCKSPLVSEEIIDDPVYPEFAFTIEPASCNENDGYAALYITNDVDIASIVWSQNGETVLEGPLLAEVPMGTYKVTVTTRLGCSADKDIEIKTDIHPFNGVSRNNDGKNDIFHINCIESFPGNLVKIFNRAGTLVYEAEGYDNIDIYFDGKSNKGISLMGTNLPDGTYFYIVDKRDGSKPLAGYLEIVN